MTTAWFHCFAGTAGDMTMAALVDAGADPLQVVQIVGALPVDHYALTFDRVQRCGVGATQALVAVLDEHHGLDEHHDLDEHAHAGHAPHRPYSHIRNMLDTADLPDRVRARAQRVFLALAEVEAAIHGTGVDEVEFHEVGSIDAIVDIVGACAALEVLGIDRIVCSPISVGRGTVRAAHGVLPNPAPAVMSLLARCGAPSVGIDEPLELATPTGVALMTALADEFGPMPALRVQSVGYGAGGRDTPGRPNVVQVVVGTEPALTRTPGDGQPVQLLEVNVDDATGEVIAHTITALLAAGAHDAWATPIVMKKGRPAYTVHALCDPAAAHAVGAVLVRETGSLGLRGTVLQRWPQQRHDATVHVHGHAVRVKMADGRAKVEHDDAAAAATALGLPLREVLHLATEAARHLQG